MSEIYKCIVGNFNINDAFNAIDLLSEDDYLSVSCFQKADSWFVEVLSSTVPDVDKLRSALKREFEFVEKKQLEEIDWLQKCFENFKPITVGSFYIYGPHLRQSQKPTDKISIEIAAATAFGTGEHPTTNRCLIASETFFDPEKHNSALDIGCGSCILSIALAKLGAHIVDACDNDSEAVKISKKNIVINNVPHRINVFQNQATEFSDKKYDFIVANILATPLIEMSKAIVESLNNKGLLVLSGFATEDHSVLKAFKSLGLKLKCEYELDGWSTLVMEHSA